jgi:hypothetical protein
LAAACRKVSHYAAVAQRKGNVIRKFRSQGNCGPWKELATASRKMTHCAGVAWPKEHRHKGQNEDDVAARCPKGQAFGKRRWKGLKCNNGIRYRGPRQQLRGSKRIKDLGGRQTLYLRKERTTTNGIGGWHSGKRSHQGSRGTLKKTLYEIFRGNIKKQVVGTSSGLRRMMDLTFWRGRPPQKRKKKLHT